MEAIVLHEIGPAENLKVETRPTPVPDKGEVLVRVRACAVCFRDILDRTGKFPFIRLPIIPGHEFAGDVVEVGEDVADLSVGDRVVNVHKNSCGHCASCVAGDEIHCSGAWVHFGLTADGGYAQFVRAPATALVELPASIPYSQGASIMCTTGTAFRALLTQAGLSAGETVLVTGASGGVGTQAIQVAHLVGARVIAVTTSPWKAETVKAAGADEVLVAPGGNFHKDLLARTDGGVEVALDLVGGPTFNSSLRSLKPAGRLVLVGNVTGERVELNPGLVILKSLKIAGSDSITRHQLRQVLRLVTEGRLRPTVTRELPLADAASAHQSLEQRKESGGRIVLIPH